MANRIRARILFTAAASVTGLAIGQSAFATAYWDLNGTTAGAVGDGVTPGLVTGTWDAGTLNWNTDSTGGAGGAIGSWVPGDIAVFSAGTNGGVTGTPSIITVVGTQSITGLETQEGPLTFNGTAGTAKFSITGNTSFNIGVDTRNENLIEGDGRLIKDGAAKLTLVTVTSPVATSYTFTGGTTVNAGALQFNGDRAFGAVPTVLTGGNNILINNNATLMHGNGGTSVTIAGTREIVISAAGATFDAVGTGSTIYNGDRLTGSGTITKKGNNLLVFGAENLNFTGKFVVQAGSLTINDANTADTNFGAIPANYTSDAITLETGGGLRVGGAATNGFVVHANRGITLGTGGGNINSAAGAGPLTIDSIITGVGSLTKSAAVDVTLNGANNYTGGTILQAGTLQVKRLHENNAVNITGGTLRVLESTPGLGSGHPAGDNAFVSRPSSLTIAPGAKLDLTNNDLILDYSGASPIATYEALVASGYVVGVGDWSGTGITSSTAALDGNYVVAIADNAALAAPFGTANGGPLFAGVDVDIDTILIKFTHRADVDLDGVITPNDAAIFGGNYSENDPAVWATGDMDYDGIFTPNDAAIFGGFYDESLASLPEPGTIWGLAVAGLWIGRRRR